MFNMITAWQYIPETEGMRCFMQTVHAGNETKLNDPQWCFLAEYPITELMVDKDIRGNTKSEVLIQITDELGIGAELFKHIERTLIELTFEAMAQFDQGRYAAPTVRLFCQRKVAERVNSIITIGQNQAGQSVNSTQRTNSPARESCGGWGYFVVERGRHMQSDPDSIAKYWVDVFLYKEGE